MIPILLIPFGATNPTARAIYARLEREVRTRHPKHPVQQAYTATSIVARLRAEGEAIRTVAEACWHLHHQGHRKAIAFSLHLVPGEKHQAIQGGSGLQLHVTHPLLDEPASIEGVAEELQRDMPPDRPVLVVAHGHASRPQHHAHLEALGQRLRAQRPDVLLRRLEGPEDEGAWSDFVQRAQAHGSAHIIPFFLVPGEHVQEDILGNHPHSLRHRLGISNVTCAPTLGERPWVIERFLDRLRTALENA